MSEPTLRDLQSHLAGYLAGNSSLSEFRNGFDVETWGLAAQPDSLIRQVAGEIELRLAELTNGHRSESDLRELLRPLVEAWLTTEATNTTIFPASDLPVSFGRPGAEIFSLETVPHY
jgi:hypothetical protein